MNSKIILTAATLTVLAAGCGSGLYVPSPAHVSQGTTLERLMHGRELYVAKCGNCHSLKSPSEYSVEVWRKNLDEMQTRARITDAEKAVMLEYLAAGSRVDQHSLQLPRQTPIFVREKQKQEHRDG
jgi:hypothetical protein